MPEDLWSLPLFARLVKELRHEQCEYFKTKNPDRLAQSKVLERKVDQAITDIFTQPRLFS
jgi:hypothetical protein